MAAKKQTQKRPAGQAAAQGGVKIKYVRRSFFWNVFAVLLAFLLGILFTVGAVAGVGYFAATKFSLKDVLGALKVDYEKYIEADYADMTLLDLWDEVSKTQFTNLAAIGKFTPILKEQLNIANDNLADFGIDLNVNRLMETDFSELGAYFQDDVVAKAQLGGMLGVGPDDSALMLALCYGKEGVDYDIVTAADGTQTIRMRGDKAPTTVGDLTEDANGILEGMELGTMLDVTAESDPLTIAICYGEEGTNYTVEDGEIVPVDAPAEEGKIAYPVTVGTLMDDATGVIDNVKVETALSVTAASEPALRYLAYGSEGEQYTLADDDGDGTPDRVQMLDDPATGKPYEKRSISSLTEEDSDLIGGAAIRDLVGIDTSEGSEDSAFMQAIADWKVNDLKDEEKVESLKIGDVFDTEDASSSLMHAISSWELGDLKQQARIDRLRLSQVLDLGDDSSTLMQTIGDWRLGELSDQEKIDSLRLGDVLEIEEGNSSNFLLALQDTTLGELSERSDMLTLSEIIGEDELQKNKLLKHLGNSTIQTLSDDVNAISLETIFGEEYFSYAATADYEAARGAGKPVESDKLLDPERVQTVYKTAAGTQVVTGTFLITEQGGWKLLEGVTANIYRWQRPVDAVKEYRIVNYETGTLDPLPDGADVVTEGGKDYYVTGGERYEIVKTDPYADYVEIGGERIDLELTVVAYLYSDTQAAVPADVTVAYDGEADAYYVTESAETLRRYYDPTALSPEGIAPEVYGEDDVTVSFFTQEGEPVTRFVAGAWMLIVGEDGAKGATSVMGISDALEDIPEQVSNLTLQEMYCNGLLTDDPSLDISRLNYMLDGKLYTDLDQFNIRQFTEFVEYLLGQVPTEP